VEKPFHNLLMTYQARQLLLLW